MRVRTTVAIALLTGAFCFSAGWILSPGPYRLVYITAKPLLVTNSRGESLGRIPAGTHVISKLRLSNSPDIGWWCFVPVSLGTMAEALPAVTFAGKLSTFGYVSEMLNARVMPVATHASTATRSKINMRAR